METSAVFFRQNDTYILASAKDVFGIHHASEPFFKLSGAVSEKDLGERVLEALAAFREGIPGKTYPRGVKQPLDPFLIFAGFKSWRAFEKGAHYFWVSVTANEVEIIPSIPAAKGGYLHQSEKAVRVPARSDQIGRALSGSRRKSSMTRYEKILLTIV